MNGERSYLREAGDGLELLVQLAPRASKSRIIGKYGERLKIAVTAPPVDGKANQALCAFLAEIFGISRSSVMVIRGAASREKTLRVENLAMEEACRRLDEALANA